MGHRAASVPRHGLPHRTRTEEAAQSRRTEAAAQRPPLPCTKGPTPPAAQRRPPSPAQRRPPPQPHRRAQRSPAARLGAMAFPQTAILRKHQESDKRPYGVKEAGPRRKAAEKPHIFPRGECAGPPGKSAGFPRVFRGKCAGNPGPFPGERTGSGKTAPASKMRGISGKIRGNARIIR
jgi:hypothetical protein